MNKRSRVLAALLATTLAATSLAGCGNGGEKQKGKTAQELNFASGSSVIGMNPMMNSSAPDNSNHSKIQEPLVRYTSLSDTETKLMPGAAESWEVSDDGLHYTFHFHKDMKWSDGEPFTAKDFEYTLKRMADPKVAAENAWLFEDSIKGFKDALYNGGEIENIGVKAPDENTLEIEIVHPAAYFLELLSKLYPVRQDKIEEWGDKYGSSADKIICSGQFKIDKWDQNTETVYVKNENNWNAKNMKLDKITVKVIQEDATTIQAFLKDQIDVTSTSDPNWQKKIGECKNVVDKTYTATNPQFFLFNHKNEWLKNPKIRQALTIGFDRQEFVNTIWDGNATPIYSMVPDVMEIEGKRYTDLVDGKNYFVKDLEKENKDPKKLIKEGLKEMGKDPDPSQITIRYASRGTNEFSKKMAEWYKQTWEKNLGIHVDIDMMEWNIMWDKVDSGDYDIATAGFGSFYNEPSGILGLFDEKTGYFNATKTGWEGEDADKYHELLLSAQNMTDQMELADTYLAAEKILEMNAVICPESLGLTPIYIKDYVKGYDVNPVGNVDWTLMSVETSKK